jgi:hypothetical protein
MVLFFIKPLLPGFMQPIPKSALSYSVQQNCPNNRIQASTVCKLSTSSILQEVSLEFMTFVALLAAILNFIYQIRTYKTPTEPIDKPPIQLLP